MKRLLFLAILTALSMTVFGQSWSEIRTKSSEYFSDESAADTKVQAIKKADINMAKLIDDAYTFQFRLLDDEQRSMANASEEEIREYAKSKIASYKLQEKYHTLEIQDEPTVIVGRYMSRKEVEDAFAKRKLTINRYVGEAIAAENERNLAVALRYYYWSYVLLKTLREPAKETYTDRMNNTYMLATWLPEQINQICQGIRVNIAERSGNTITLKFTYKGKGVSNLDFRCKVGSTWGMIYSAKDGQGEVELPTGYSEDEIEIKYEFKYEEESEHLDRVVYDAFSFLVGNIPVRSGTSNVALDASYATDNTFKVETTAKEMSHIAELTDNDKQKYESTIETVVQAIKLQNTVGLEKYFTTDGYDVFRRLIEYGSAKVKNYSELSYTRMGDDVIVRSIPMSFSFRNGSVRTFIEDVVFTINAQGLISNISFGLGKEATAAIMARDKWGDTIQQQVINFLEVYKTAYALKRYDYLETLFADNAVIIVGRVVMKTSKYPDADRYGAHKIVVKTRFTKTKYMEHVKKCFDSNEFINIRFARTSVTKKNKEQIFGIQLKQYYNSTTYGDEGYLFLQVDMRNPSEPVIMVRTWQEDYDPEVGRPYGMQDF